MAEEQPSLHIDTDWKKQAQEEKRKLAEQEAQRAAERDASRAATSPAPAGAGMAAPSAGPASAGAGSPAAGAARGRGGAAGARGQRELPEASFGTLVNSLVTQVLLYLGDLTPRGVEPQVNLDMARFNVDLLNVIEEKTKGNLNADEQRLLDNALYETRMRFVSVASAYATV
jgi:hypothetical protein